MLIDDEGTNHGTVSTAKALEMAKEKDLDRSEERRVGKEC